MTFIFEFVIPIVDDVFATQQRKKKVRRKIGGGGTIELRGCSPRLYVDNKVC